MIIFVILMIFTIKHVVTNHQLPSWSWSRSDQLVTRGLAILAPSSSLPSSLSSPPSSSSSLSLEYFIFRRGELLGTFKNNIWYFMVLQTLWGGRDELVQLPYQCALQCTAVDLNRPAEKISFVLWAYYILKDLRQIITLFSDILPLLNEKQLTILT